MQLVEKILLEAQTSADIDMVQQKLNDAGYMTDDSNGSSLIVGLYDDKADELDSLLKTMNIFGYYPAAICDDEGRVDEKFERYIADKYIAKHGYLNLKFVKKYDGAGEEMGELYHATSAKYVKRIMRQGLVPKSMGKIEGHPERIYLTTSLDDAEILAVELSAHLPDGYQDMVILKVDASDLPIKFYRDPATSTLSGVYTTSNIPPSAITILKHAEFPDLEW